MSTIIGICGSLRRQSFNGMLLRAIAEAMPDGTRIEVASLREIPLYDGDLEAEQGLPPVVQQLKERIVQSDGLLIVSPEYNNGIPGVVKNALDWLSRPANDIPRVFRGRRVAIAGATPGQGGTMVAQAAWWPVLRSLGVLPWFDGRLMISGAGKVFDAQGQIVDPAMRDRVRGFAEGLATFVRPPAGT